MEDKDTVTGQKIRYWEGTRVPRYSEMEEIENQENTASETRSGIEQTPNCSKPSQESILMAKGVLLLQFHRQKMQHVALFRQRQNNSFIRHGK